MTVVFIILLVVVILFTFVLAFGAPYLPTLSKQQVTALELLNLKSGQTLLELGSGDGRMLKAAAKKGIKSVGYELNPLLFIYSKLLLWPYRDLARVRYGNFWNKTLTGYDGIYVFLLDRYMSKLNKKITQEIDKTTSVVSFAFKFPEQKTINDKDGLFLYKFTPIK